jgi:hypothetical protein
LIKHIFGILKGNNTMSNITKQQIMEALKAQKEKSQRTNKTQSSGGDNASYPFWNIDVGATATVRFLPDKDPNNTFFWVKREVIKLPFAGVEGGDYPTNKDVIVTVPCVEMWGDQCPVVQGIRPWWNDPAKKETARIYWKKKSYIFQGFVVSSPFEENPLPENPIRRFVINPSIFEIIEKSLLDPEMEDMPTDYVGGVDFRIRKTKKGDYSNYSTSEWSRKTRSLSEDEQAAIAQYGLWNLADYQGQRPDSNGIEMIKQMFEDSVAGRPFDYASYGASYRPFSDRNDDTPRGTAQPVTQSVNTARETAAPAATTEEAKPAVTTSAPAQSSATANAQEILERIKARTLNNAQ